MPDSPEEITELLRMAQASDPVVREFAWVWMEAFRRDTIEVLRLHRQEGRAAALRGDDPGPARRRSEERLEAARQRFLDRLRRLMAWARESGRTGE